MIGFGLMGLLVLAVYGVVIIALVLFVRAVGRMSDSFAEMSQSLKEIAFTMRSKPPQ